MNIILLFELMLDITDYYHPCLLRLFIDSYYNYESYSKLDKWVIKTNNAKILKYLIKSCIIKLIQYKKYAIKHNCEKIIKLLDDVEIQIDSISYNFLKYYQLKYNFTIQANVIDDTLYLNSNNLYDPNFNILLAYFILLIHENEKAFFNNLHLRNESTLNYLIKYLFIQKKYDMIRKLINKITHVELHYTHVRSIPLDIILALDKNYYYNQILIFTYFSWHKMSIENYLDIKYGSYICYIICITGNEELLQKCNEINICKDILNSKLSIIKILYEKNMIYPKLKLVQMKMKNVIFLLSKGIIFNPYYSVTKVKHLYKINKYLDYKKHIDKLIIVLFNKLNIILYLHDNNLLPEICVFLFEPSLVIKDWFRTNKKSYIINSSYEY